MTAVADQLTAVQRRKAAVCMFIMEKQRHGLTNITFFLLSAPSVLTATFRYLQSQGELIHIITVMYLTY